MVSVRGVDLKGAGSRFGGRISLRRGTGNVARAAALFDTPGMNQRTPDRVRSGHWATSVLIATVIGSAMIVWLWVEANDAGAAVPLVDLLNIVFTVLSYGVAGAVLIDRRPDLVFGWLLAGTAVSQVILGLAALPAITALETGTDSSLIAWGLALTGLGFIPVAVHGLVYVRFPSGRTVSRSGRILEICIVVGTGMVVFGALFGATAFTNGSLSSGSNLEHPLTGGTPIGAVADALVVAAPVVVFLGLLAGMGVIRRFVQADGMERQQLKWMATWIVISFMLFPLALTGRTDFVDPFVSLLFVLMLAIPVLRYRLWAIDTILRRSVIYGVVTVVLVCTYAVLTSIGIGLFSERVGALVAAVAVALAFVPLRNRVQGLVERFTYGNRSDPYRTISDLDRRLSEIAIPGEVLPALVETIADSLRLPYVVIERTDGSVLASHGQSGGIEERWPLVYEGVREGDLVASPRRGEDAFEQRDREILADLARHTGTALHAEMLTTDLLVSRQRLVTTREEERRRLRRDIHDGLGPVLASIGLNIDAARSQIDSNPQAAAHYLGDAKAATAQAIDSVRRLVYGLRPPALDNHGLVGAIRLHTDRLTSEETRIHVRAEELPDLPAAIEVVAYRTVMEAVTNAFRHGNATNCNVTLATRSNELVVDIEDDGQAIGPWVPGVGLTSIREQTEELGGRVEAGSLGSKGARVTVRLPLPKDLP